MQIVVDGDGCPVVNQSIALAKKYKLPCLILCDTAHRIQREGAVTKVVDKGADSVDFALVNLLHKGDIVVTQDYGLAVMCLSRDTHPIHQDGWLYTVDNIDGLLLARHTAKKIRRGGGRLHGSAKRTTQQDEVFEAALGELIGDRVAICMCLENHKELVEVNL